MIFSLFSPFVFTLFAYHLCCVTHGLREAPVEIYIARDVSLLIFRAETSALVNEVGVLLCSITGFSICSRVCQKRFLAAKVGHYFSLRGIKVTKALKRYFAEGFHTVLKQLEVF